MRDEFESEPPSSQEAEGSKEDGFRKKEKKLKGDKKFDKGGKMSSKGGSLSAIYPCRDREMKELTGYGCGADSMMTKKVRQAVTTKALSGMRHSLRRATELESLLIFCLTKQSLTIRSRGSLVRVSREVARSEVDTARAILGQAYAAITNSEEILLAAIIKAWLLTSTRIQSGVKINVKHLVPYFGDTSDDENSRANSVHPRENDEDNDEIQELVANSWKNRKRYDSQRSGECILAPTSSASLANDDRDRLNHYCELGCASSLCSTISTINNPNVEAVEGCVKSCSLNVCTKYHH
ncbi:hypothetical protein Syun_011288 [Stephania yunnanensis]|uniref:Uncharacterized protein n=1 Tax=Stephania yunnanensis TaxID=152371 RepID=A0AAP0JYI0_9MAGN